MLVNGAYRQLLHALYPKWSVHLRGRRATALPARVSRLAELAAVKRILT